jgi:hypothetical protein
VSPTAAAAATAAVSPAGGSTAGPTAVQLTGGSFLYACAPDDSTQRRALPPATSQPRGFVGATAAGIRAPASTASTAAASTEKSASTASVSTTVCRLCQLWPTAR